jgi:insertion element IS1 protein InsB
VQEVAPGSCAPYDTGLSTSLLANHGPCGITRYYTDDWDASTRQLHAEAHNPGKRNTQKIERKRLVRKTICLSRSIEMHDIVIGL